MSIHRRDGQFVVLLRQHGSGGSYSIYYALAVASKELDSDHKFVSLRLCGNMMKLTIRHTDLTSPTPNQQPRSAPFLNGRAVKRLWRWTLGVTLLPGSSKT